MKFDYTLKLDLPLEQAWATLMDIERIAPCMPGATIESHEGDDYTGRLKVKLGPMELTYRGDIHFVERDDAGKRAVVDASAKEIKGRGAARTQVTLSGSAGSGGSEIALSSDFTVSGKAAQFGRGVMEEVGEKLMDDFAARLAAMVNAEGVPQADTDRSDATATGTTVSDNAALDISSAAWWPVLKRLLLPAAIVILIVMFAVAR